MKKLISLLLALALVFSLAACAGKNADDARTETEPDPVSSRDGEEAEAEGGSLSEGGLFTATTGSKEAEAAGEDGYAVFEPDYAAGSEEAMGAGDFALFGKGEAAAPGVYEYSREFDGTFPDAEYTTVAPEPSAIIDDPIPEPITGGDDVDPGISVDPIDPIDPIDPWYEPVQADAFVLTAAEWNDNENWPFFTNLVNTGKISFPSFGLDPTHRIKVTAEGGWPYYLETRLLDEKGNILWSTDTGKDGVAYLFYKDGEEPAKVSVNGIEFDLPAERVSDGAQQGGGTMKVLDEVTVDVGAFEGGPDRSGLQVMFIVDTTGSMGDEILYLQKDFSSIAAEVGSNGVEYSVCFYRDEGDEYVTKVSEFTDNVSAVQSLINEEYADGGGDIPEAVAQILNETLRWDFVEGHNGWRQDSVKIAFLIYDAPPHNGTDETIEAAVKRAAEMGIHLVPVVCSNGDRETELFGRALSILTNGTYVFLTDDSGVGGSHLEPIVGSYEVEKLHDIIVRIIDGYRP